MMGKWTAAKCVLFVFSFNFLSYIFIQLAVSFLDFEVISSDIWSKSLANASTE